MTLSERLEFIMALDVISGALEDLQKAVPQADIKEDIFILNDIVTRSRRQLRGKDDTTQRSNDDRTHNVGGGDVVFLWARPQDGPDA